MPLIFHLPSPGDNIELGEPIVAVAVTAASVIKDIRENIKNLVGGEMPHYQALIERTAERALERLSEKAQQKGYHGVAGIILSHPSVVEGGVEVVASGNGFWFVS